MLTEREVDINADRADGRAEQEIMRGRPRRLAEPHVLMATRMVRGGQFGGSVVPVSFISVMLVHQGMRQRRGGVGGPDGESEGGGEQTPIAHATHSAKLC